MKKYQITTTTLLFLFFNLLTIKASVEVSIPLKNTLGFDRTNELVEVNIEGVTDFSELSLYDELENPVAYQVISSNTIVFPVSISAETSLTYTLKSGVPATNTTKTYVAQKMPTTRNDIVWENDLCAYRLYSKVLLSSQPNTANGQDIWYKKQNSPIIDKMYTYSNYHSEQTEGVDAYSVNGKTLGGGGIAVYANNQLWLHDPYDSCKIISNGPLRSEFILTYKNVEIDGDYYTKTLHITTNANGLLNKAVVKYKGNIKPMKIATGIYLHDNMSGVTPAGLKYSTEKNIIGYAEAPSEGTVTSSNPRMYTGVYMPGTTTTTTIDNHLVIMSDYAVGSEFTYYFGAGWNAFPVDKYLTDTDWFDALDEFKETINAPLNVNSNITLPDKEEVINTGLKVNNYWISKNTNPGNNLWARAVYHIGNIEFYKTYPDKLYKNYSTVWAEQNNWLISGGPATSHADNHTAGQVYLDLYNMDVIKNETKYNSIKNTLDYVISNKTESADWWWVDAMFMAMPTFIKLGNVTNDSKYYEKAYALYANTRDTLVVASNNSAIWPSEYRSTYGAGPIVTCSTCGNQSDGLYNSTDSLWYRDWGYQPNIPPKKSYSTNLTSDVAKESPNGENIYWARGNGWAIAAMARTLESLPENNEHRSEYISMLKQMAGALKARQREDGFWNMNLGDSNHYSGKETSGTAFFTYAIAWGINNEILDKDIYLPVVTKAWNGLTNLAVETSGNLLYTQNVGESPIDPSRLSSSSVDFGVGAFLLATSEVAKLADGDMPQPTLDNIYLLSVEIIDNKHLEFKFDEELDETTATNLNNYSLNNTTMEGTIELSSSKSVTITLDSELDYGKYEFTVSNILSKYDNPIVPGASKTIIYTVPLTAIESGITVTAIANQSGNTPSNTIDNKISTRWSQAGINQWIKYDLGKIANVYAVDLAFYFGDRRSSYFDIQLSTDNVVFTTVLSGGETSGITNEMERYKFEQQQAQYVRIMCKGNSTGGENWNSITEARIRYKDLTGLNTVNWENSNLIIYPNPINGTSIEFSTNKSLSSKIKLQIFDLVGNLIEQRQISTNGNKASINNLNLAQGYYILSIESDLSKRSAAFIVKR